ncbi:unnamed protein product [Lactuca virosa]|uniref:Uncharacterized protein n=1 Tax=Lactuca virosa TaxID=75947 RepID=A0AAU9PAT5_9ASTR|nr:unnamed protein product [Lactuca virosa]
MKKNQNIRSLEITHLQTVKNPQPSLSFLPLCAPPPSPSSPLFRPHQSPLTLAPPLLLPGVVYRRKVRKR